MHLVTLIHLLGLIVAAQGSVHDAAAFYSVGYNACLAVEAQHHVRVGSPRVVLAPAEKPLRVTVDAMVPWEAPSTKRRVHGDCTDAYRSNLEDAKGARATVTQFAHVSTPPADPFDYSASLPFPRRARSSSAAHQTRLARWSASSLSTAFDGRSHRAGTSTARSFAPTGMRPRPVTR